MSQCRELVDEGCLAQADPKSFIYRMYRRIRKEPAKKELVQVIWKQYLSNAQKIQLLQL